MSIRISQRLAVVLGAAAFAAAGAAGAAETPQPSKGGVELQQKAEALRGKTIAWVPVTLGFPLADEWTAVMKQEAEAAGMKLVVRDPGWNATAQLQAVSALIGDKVDVVVVQNPNVQLLAKELKRANENGAFVVQVNMASNHRADAFVGANFIRIGQMLGEEVIKACGKGSGTSGKVQIVQGELTATASLDQMAGLMAALNKDDTIKVVSDQAAGWDANKALDITSSVIQQHPDLCASVGFWGIMQAGAAQAIKAAGKLGKVKIYASGEGSRSDCDMIQQGLFDKFVNYNAKQQGHDIMQTINFLLQSGQKPGSLYIANFSELNWLDKETGKGDACWDLKK
ncbi:sugar ABC transporter substrate-binding protein [Chelatococcus reniformis]|uniref:ABC transporter substrate-binding protein n=1 Tax=Chelatococcus reniformis TaxID=1494448 RepID=A0A916TY93_9HYPH|nr:sugar ABC transporter substrate-binding protein [Chelatococcus reniformis]GGC48116.1 ABC transporter substrate-binding protein [Chelatococcus reniformis]